MKQFLKGIVLSFLLGVFSIPVHAEQISPSESLYNKLVAIKSFSSNFKQIIYKNSKEVLFQSSGKMALEQPDKVYWEVLNPEQSLLISNGHTLWSFEPSLWQVTIKNLKKEEGDNLPITFLFSHLKDLDHYFHIELDDPKNILNSPFDNLEVYRLTPKMQEYQLPYDHLQIGFDADKIVGIQLRDKLQQIVQLQFQDVELNVDFNDDLFEFTPPEGVDIVG